MAIGSSFDAHVKSYLHQAIFGKTDPKFELRTLFEAQVEEQCRELAWHHGKYAFDCYKGSGALSDLMLEIQRGGKEPRFEFIVQGAVAGQREGIEKEIHEVVLHGRPDAAFVNSADKQVILDFKVSGFYSDRPPSPLKGYVRLRGRDGRNLGEHHSAYLMVVDGVTINIGNYLEDLNEDWARQLAIYSWLLGNKVGENVIVAIDQLCCDSTKGVLPEIKTAEHRVRIGKEFQERLFVEILEIWEIVQSDYYFRDMSFEESAARCKLLDEQAAVLKGDGSVNDQWFKGMLDHKDILYIICTFSRVLHVLKDTIHS